MTDPAAARGLAGTRTITACSAVALAAALCGAVALLTAGDAPALGVVLRVLGAIVAPVAIGAALGGLLLRAGALRSRSRATFCVAAGLAAVLGGLAQASWSVGFDEADAGVPQSPFAEAFVGLLLAGAVAAAVAGAVLARALLRDMRPRWLQAVVAVVVVVLGVPVVGLSLLMPTTAVAGSLALLVVALRSHRTTAAGPAVSAPARLDSAPALRHPAVVPLASITAVVGALAAVLALTGAAWLPFLDDGTAAMNAGLAVGALAAVPLAIALHLLAPRVRGSRAAAVLGAAALVVEAGSQAAGAGSPAQTPLWILAATLAGTAVAVLLVPLLGVRTGPVGGALLTLGVAAAVTAVAGLIGIVVAPLAAPLGALVLLGVLARGSRRAPAPA